MVAERSSFRYSSSARYHNEEDMQNIWAGMRDEEPIDDQLDTAAAFFSH